MSSAGRESGVEWNGVGFYDDNSGEGPAEYTVDTKDDEGFWCFLHVCCDCWRVHEVKLGEVAKKLEMRWYSSTPEQVAQIHEKMRKDKRPRYCIDSSTASRALALVEEMAGHECASKDDDIVTCGKTIEACWPCRAREVRDG